MDTCFRPCIGRVEKHHVIVFLYSTSNFRWFLDWNQFVLFGSPYDFEVDICSRSAYFGYESNYFDKAVFLLMHTAILDQVISDS